MMYKKKFYSKRIVVLLVCMALFLVVSCAGTPPGTVGFSAVRGRDWQLIALRTAGDGGVFDRGELEALEMGDAYTLRFDEDRVSGRGAPNRYFAPYELGEGSSLSIQAMGSTLMASFREPSGLREGDYFTYLQGVDRWELVGEELRLHTRDSQGGALTLVFSVYP
jgi:heat shock protein HslJ